jgi:hypothetical protein
MKKVQYIVYWIFQQIWIAKATAMTLMGKYLDAEEFLIAVSQQEDDETTKKNCIQALQKLQV